MKGKIPICALLCLNALAPQVKAELLATFETSWGGGRIGVFDWITHETFIAEEFGVFKGEGTLFEDVVIYSGETRVDTITWGDDPDFPIYVELITDGVDWWLYDLGRYAGGLFGGTGQFDLESARLDIIDPGHGGVDLEGYQVESITRTLTVLLDSPGGDPNGDGNWTDYDISGVFEFYGTIPEPSSLVLVAFGAGCLWRRRRGRH